MKYFAAHTPYIITSAVDILRKRANTNESSSDKIYAMRKSISKITYLQSSSDKLFGLKRSVYLLHSF